MLYVSSVVFVMGSVDKSTINMIKICAALDFYFDRNHFAVNVVVHLQLGSLLSKWFDTRRNTPPPVPLGLSLR